MPLALSPHRLREARDKAALTRQDAATLVGCSITGLQQWERGWREPGVNVVANLARLYGVSMDSFFHDDVNDDAAGDGCVELTGTRT